MCINYIIVRKCGCDIFQEKCDDCRETTVVFRFAKEAFGPSSGEGVMQKSKRPMLQSGASQVVTTMCAATFASPFFSGTGSQGRRRRFNMCFCKNSSATFAALRDAPAERWMCVTQSDCVEC